VSFILILNEPTRVSRATDGGVGEEKPLDKTPKDLKMTEMTRDKRLLEP
jgi:hypothetical protein